VCLSVRLYVRPSVCLSKPALYQNGPPNLLWYTDIFGLEVYNRMQKLSYCASVNAWCNFCNRCHQIGVRAVAGRTPATDWYLCFRLSWSGQAVSDISWRSVSQAAYIDRLTIKSLTERGAGMPRVCGSGGLHGWFRAQQVARNPLAVRWLMSLWRCGRRRRRLLLLLLLAAWWSAVFCRRKLITKGRLVACC